MIIALAVLGFMLLNVLLAYVPIMLIVAHSLKPQEGNSPEERYMRDEISTERYLELTDTEWAGREHAPLT
jgi:ABC-type spermidine/putrescine transport system permease subunit II